MNNYRIIHKNTLKNTCCSFMLWLTAVLPLIVDADRVIVFRYDDYSFNDPVQRERDKTLQSLYCAEKSMDSLFASVTMPYVAAVIPSATNEYSDKNQDKQERKSRDGKEVILDTGKINLLKRALLEHRVEICQHGYNHFQNPESHGVASEFFSASLKNQLQRIGQGRDILCSIFGLTEIAAFVPPWNSWDGATAQALERTGFSILSADRHYINRSSPQLTVIPFTAQLWELEEMIAKSRLRESSIVVVLFHPPQLIPYKGQEHRYYGIQRLANLLHLIRSDTTIKVQTLSMVVSQNKKSLSYRRYVNASLVWYVRGVWERVLPKRLLPGERDQGLYLDASEYFMILLVWICITGCVGFVVSGSVYLVRRQLIVKKLTTNYRRIDLVMSSFFCLFIGVWIQSLFQGHFINAQRFFPLFLFLPFFLSSCKYFFLKRKKSP